MAERDFEAELERMFNQPPAFADNEAFARRVNSRLDKSWRLRVFGLATAGGVGGLIAISQTIGTNFGLRLTEASTQSVQRVDGAYERAVSQLEGLGGVDLAAFGLNGNLVAMMAIALILGMAAMGMRLIDEA
jgi:hypothetical protein